MLVAINYILDMFSDLVGMIVNLKIPNGYGGYISMRAIILFFMLCAVAWGAIKLFLTKGFKKYGKD